MPVVAVELIAPGPPAVMAHTLLDSCSRTVREGRCVLSSSAVAEPRIAIVTVRFDDASEGVARVEVRAGDGAPFALHSRVIVFKKTDARVERWRTVGLTIATLVGDALAPTAGEPTGVTHGSEATLADVPPGTAVIDDANVERPHESSPVAAPIPRSTNDEKSVTAPLPASASAITPASPSDRPSTARGLPHALWVGVSGALGPGLESGAWRWGASIDAGLRAKRLPLFAHLGLSYRWRPADSRGLSVQWQGLTLGGGVALGSVSLRIEPRLAIGIENIHAAVTDRATGRSDSGDQLGLSAHAAVDGVWQWSRGAAVATFDGFAAHSPTQIVVKERPFGTAAAAGFCLGLGARYFFE
jgi:hypothetical protein